MKITRSLLSSLTFRPFTRTDYLGFCGVESPVPLICETPDLTVIIDGCYAELYVTEDGDFIIADQVEDIRKLPYKTEQQEKIEAEIDKLEKAIASLKGELVEAGAIV